MYDDDLEQLEAGMLVYDAFYRWCRDATGETHNSANGKANPKGDAVATNRPLLGGHPLVRSSMDLGGTAD